MVFAGDHCKDRTIRLGGCYFSGGCPILKHASPLLLYGNCRMRESSCTDLCGAIRNGRSYRDSWCAAAKRP